MKDRLKVLHVIDGGGGGASSHVLSLASGLFGFGVSPEILFFSGGTAVDDARRLNIPFHMVLRKRSRLSFMFRMYRLLSGNRYDVVHTHTLNGNFFGRVAGRMAGVPKIVTTVHGHIIEILKDGKERPSLKDRLIYRFEIFCTRWSNALIAVSEPIRERLEREGIQPEKISVVCNGVDTNLFRPNAECASEMRRELGIRQDTHVVGIVGRMVALKNHDIFIEAAKKVIDKGKNITFVLVGDGPLMAQNKKKVQMLDIESRVRFTGWRSDIHRLHCMFDTFVLCSKVEGLNVAILEAMACGKPIIGTNVTGINNLVDDKKNGLLVLVDRSEELADAIISLIELPLLAKKLGDAGRKKVIDGYSLNRMVEDNYKLYKRIVEQ